MLRSKISAMKKLGQRLPVIWIACTGVFALFVGVLLGAYIYRARVKAVRSLGCLPDSMTVRIDSTNLPIVFINSHNNRIDRRRFISAYVKIIDNGAGSYNYGDTVSYPNQKVDYEGWMAIRHRGNTSYSGVAKKPYALRALDVKGGKKKKKSKLLGMRKGKKWALKSGGFDKSMIRDALTFELARQYMDYVSQTRFCEVVVDGVYHGVYCLMEQIEAHRLGLEKPGHSDDELTGGYLLQIDWRNKATAVMSSDKWDIGYLCEYPDKDKISQPQKEYVQNYIKGIEGVLQNKEDSLFEQQIDMVSMIDYQLSSELSHNADAYGLSTFMYKHRDDNDKRLKFCLWDFDLGYGNYAIGDCSNADTWVYEKGGRWWKEAMKRPEYADRLRARWREYREGAYSDENIVCVIDSLTNLLTACGAEKRNTAAWKHWDFRWGQNDIRPQKYMSASYEEEIEYLKYWISRRLEWMDKELLGREVEEKTID